MCSIRGTDSLAASSKVSIKMKLLITLFLLAIASQDAVIDAQDNVYNCGDEIKSSGTLVIPENKAECIFNTADGTLDLMLETDGLLLTVNDTLTITSVQMGKSFTYAPPFDAGYLHIGGDIVKPTLNFTLKGGKAMKITFTNDRTLKISADMNHNFKITSVGGFTDLVLKFDKTVNESVLVELNPPPEDKELILGNHLMSSNSTREIVYAKADKSQVIRVKTTIVNKTCSNSFDIVDKPVEIVGPDQVSFPYECANLFRFGIQNPTQGNYLASYITNSDERKYIVIILYTNSLYDLSEAHFDVDFKNFISLADQDDELIIKDALRRIFIDKSSEVTYKGTKISNTGRDLIIMYRSPIVTKNRTPTGLRLTVIPANYGGVVFGSSSIKLPTGTPATYTLIPDESRCAVITSTGIIVSENASLTLSGAVFGPNTELPPVIGTSERSKQLTISYSGKKDLSMQFSSDDNCCHRISSDLSGRFSLIGGQKEACLWTVAPGEEVAIRFDENDLGPNDCVTIQSLTAKVPLYSRCGIKVDEVIPSFVVSQAYVNVSLPTKGSKFSASLTKAPKKLSLYESVDSSSIKSAGYAISYPVMSGNEFYSLNATKKNYLLSVADIDLRTGEKLLVGKAEVNQKNLLAVGDLIISNSTVNITLTRPPIPTDFSLHKGVKIAITAFDDIQVLNANITTKVNNSLIKISSPPAHRINYNITSASGLKLFDGRSMSSPAR